MPSALISLGSNSGDRENYLHRACVELSRLRRTCFAAESTRRETIAIGGPDAQPPFLNSAVRLETTLSPRELFYELQRIEAGCDRVRETRWGPRTLDLDLLLFGNGEWETEDFTVPHPRLVFRRFVLEPAAEIAPEMTHPVNGWTMSRLLENLNHAPAAIAICGIAAEAVARACAGAVSIPVLVGLRTDVKLLVVAGDDEETLAFRRRPDAPPSFLPPDPDLAAARMEVLAAVAAMQ